MIRHDLHVHTAYSDGRNAVADLIHAAAAMRLKWLGITDHYAQVQGKLTQQKLEIVQAVQLHVVRVLQGVEVPMGLAGEITLNDPAAAGLDYMLLEPSLPALRAVHGGKRRVLCSALRMLLRAAARHARVIFAHPFNFGRLNLDVSPADIDRGALRELAQVFVARGHVFELMNNIWYWYPNLPVADFRRQYGAIVMLFGQAGCRFSLGSDAHSLCGVGNLGWALELARSCDVIKRLIDPAFFFKNRNDGSDDSA